MRCCSFSFFFFFRGREGAVDIELKTYVLMTLLIICIIYKTQTTDRIFYVGDVRVLGN